MDFYEKLINSSSIIWTRELFTCKHLKFILQINSPHVDLIRASETSLYMQSVSFINYFSLKVKLLSAVCLAESGF